MMTADQDQNDRNHVSAIEARAAARSKDGWSVDAYCDKAMLIEDVKNFTEIEHPAWQESAAVQIADNSRNSPEYRAALDANDPAVVERIHALDAESATKIQAKEDRKGGEFAAMIRERQQ